ncbi:IS701 family transposase [Streptomyces sp. NPDC058676]|uniref:IS701 family transposase n=1 Tax=unclassified Streptomyces TaxID=2593676 RepID=UPI003664773D
MLTLGVVQTGELNEFEIRSLDGELEALCASVDDVFARPASRENLRAMVRGLLSEVPRKNLWQLAEFAGHPNPDRLQGFLAKAAWDADELRDRVRAYAVAALVADDAVLIADETGDIKKGTKTAGVQRQYTGTAGRIENAQVSVHLSYGSSRGRTLIDRELYLGRAWAGTTAEHEHRCAEQGIPPERATEVATKPELARRMLERALEADVPFTYFLADEAYGQCRALRAWLEERRVRYVLAIPKNEVLPLPDGRTRQARELYALVPEETFERRSCANGAKGPREYDWASVQLAPTAEDFERHLLIRRSTVPNKKDKKAGALVREIAYFLCHTHPGVTLAELITAAGQRWMVEEAFQAAKGQAGLDEHEVRKWCSWYRHTTVCILAMAFLTAVRSRHIPTQPTPPVPQP